MDERSSASDHKLTGVWDGFTAIRPATSVPFVATLIEAGHSLSGTTHERAWSAAPKRRSPPDAVP